MLTTIFRTWRRADYLNYFSSVFNLLESVLPQHIYFLRNCFSKVQGVCLRRWQKLRHGHGMHLCIFLTTTKTITFLQFFFCIFSQFFWHIKFRLSEFYFKSDKFYARSKLIKQINKTIFLIIFCFIFLGLWINFLRSLLS